MILAFNMLFAAATVAGVCGATEVPNPPTSRAAPVTACVFSRDGSLLLAARRGEVLVLSTRDGTLQRVMKTDLHRVTSLALSASARILAVAGGNPGVSGEVLTLDLESGRVLGRCGGFTDLATSVSVSPSERVIAAASADGTVQLLSLTTAGSLASVARLEGHAGPVLSVLFGRDEATVVSGSADRSIKVWDVAGRRVLRTLSNHTGAIHCLAPRPARPDAGDPAPDACASGADDHTVRIWQPAIGRMVRIVRGQEAPVFSVAYAPDASALYSAGAEGIVRMIDADSDSILMQWRASDDWIYAVAVSPDGRHVATGDWTGDVKIWQVGNKRPSLDARFPARKPQ